MNLRKGLFVAFLLSIFGIHLSYGMKQEELVKLPSAEKLYQRLAPMRLLTRIAGTHLHRTRIGMDERLVGLVRDGDVITIDLEHFFLERTKIHEVLGGRELNLWEVAMQVELKLGEYAAYCKSLKMSMLLQKKKPDILRAILKEHPEAISKLEKAGLLEN